MSEVFTKFLREQAAKHQGEDVETQSVIDEWRAAVVQLFRRIRDWLERSDPDHVIRIDEAEHKVNEPSLGKYRIPRLELRGLGKWIGIIPKARNTVGSVRPSPNSAPERAAGRIDMTDEIRRYILYRLQAASGENEWYIVEFNSDEPKLLDQQTFELA